MNNQPSLDQQSPSEKKYSPVRLTFFNLRIALGIALVIATLFTAWTPGESTGTVDWEISQIAPIPTPLPTSSPIAPASNKPRIGIVSGHWGNDSGSVCADGFTEAELNQTIATIVQQKLVGLGYEVDLLKEFDPKLRNFKALALVSIHADSCNYVNEQATGFKVAAALANPNPERATKLTSCLRARYAQVTGLPLHSTSVTLDMTDYHAFEEIDDSTVAAIIETGFLNLDRKFLTENSDVAAQGIVDGILCYLNNESLSGPGTTSTP